ncbi:MAG: hypothetical protein IPP82_13020 [Xanthomonadales bacterium]|nr:hypothetical protein [Xanthomonadales bacterium]
MSANDFGVGSFFTRLERVVPVALQWSTALLFFIAWPEYPSESGVHLGKLMELEFLAIHAGVSLGMLVYWVPTKQSTRLLRLVGFVFFGALYLLGGYSTSGWTGTFEIAAMIVTSYSGLLWGTGAARQARIMEIGVRWFLALLVFIFVTTWLMLPKDVATWHESASVLLAGAIYFAVLGLLEFSGVYRLVRKYGNQFG